MHEQRNEIKTRADKLPVALIVRPNTGGQPIWLATWRDSTKRPMMRTAGPAHLRQRPARKNPFLEADQGRETKHESRTAASWTLDWERKPGRAPEGKFDERAALVRARDLVLAREVELLREAQESGGGPRTFAELVDLWLEERRAEVSDGELKPSTYRDYAAMLASADAPVRKHGNARMAHVAKAFGHRPVDEITGEDVEAFMRKLRAAGLSPATRKKYRTVVRMLLDFATARGVIGKNPMSTQRQKHRKGREKALKVYDLVTVEKVASKAGGMSGEVVRIAALTGLRQGELVALRWADVDFLGRRITIRATYVEGLGEDAPKSGKARTVPLSDQAALVLDRVSRREQNVRKGDLVFASAKGEHLDASALRRRYAKARDAVLVEAEKQGDILPVARFHDLRHTFGSRCASAGVPLSDLQAIMGHANVATTMIYVHYVPQHDAADRLSRAFADGTVAEAMETVPVT